MIQMLFLDFAVIVLVMTVISVFVYMFWLALFKNYYVNPQETRSYSSIYQRKQI